MEGGPGIDEDNERGAMTRWVLHTTAQAPQIDLPVFLLTQLAKAHWWVYGQSYPLAELCFSADLNVTTINKIINSLQKSQAKTFIFTR